MQTMDIHFTGYTTTLPNQVYTHARAQPTEDGLLKVVDTLFLRRSTPAPSPFLVHEHVRRRAQAYIKGDIHPRATPYSNIFSLIPQETIRALARRRSPWNSTEPAFIATQLFIRFGILPQEFLGNRPETLQQYEALLAKAQAYGFGERFRFRVTLSNNRLPSLPTLEAHVVRRKDTLMFASAPPEIPSTELLHALQFVYPVLESRPGFERIPDTSVSHLHRLTLEALGKIALDTHQGLPLQKDLQLSSV